MSSPRTPDETPGSDESRAATPRADEARPADAAPADVASDEARAADPSADAPATSAGAVTDADRTPDPDPTPEPALTPAADAAPEPDPTADPTGEPAPTSVPDATSAPDPASSADAGPAADATSDPHRTPEQGDLSLSGHPIDDGPVIGTIQPGGPPSTPPATLPTPASPASSLPTSTPERGAADAGPGQHAAARPYPPVVPDRGGDLASPTTASAEGRLPDAAPSAPTPAVATAADGPAAPDATTTTPAAPDATTATPTAAATPPAAAPAAVAAAAPAALAAAPSRRERRERDGSTDRVAHEDLPERPRKPGVGRHLLGALLGLLLTPVALLLVGIGTSRLSDVAGSGNPAGDVLGLTLLVLGAVLLAVIALLGAWSPLVPLTGGVVWGLALGTAYLVVPDLMQDTVDVVLGDRVLPAVVEQVTESAMSGLLVVVGALLLAAGVAAGRARRAGRRWAEGVALAEAARAEAVRADAARAEARAAGTRSPA